MVEFSTYVTHADAAHFDATSQAVHAAGLTQSNSRYEFVRYCMKVVAGDAPPAVGNLVAYLSLVPPDVAAKFDTVQQELFNAGILKQDTREALLQHGLKLTMLEVLSLNGIYTGPGPVGHLPGSRGGPSDVAAPPAAPAARTATGDEAGEEIEVSAPGGE